MITNNILDEKDSGSGAPLALRSSGRMARFGIRSYYGSRFSSPAVAAYHTPPKSTRVVYTGDEETYYNVLEPFATKVGRTGIWIYHEPANAAMAR